MITKLLIHPIILKETEDIDIKIKNKFLHSIILTGQNGVFEIKLNDFLSIDFLKNIELNIKNCNDKKGKQLLFNNKNVINKKNKALFGTMISYIKSGVLAIRKDYVSKLNLLGNEYNCKLENDTLILDVGYSHLVIVKPLFKNVFWSVKDKTITFFGKNKMLVKQAREIVYNIRPINTYKAKGFHKDEKAIILKEKSKKENE